MDKKLRLEIIKARYQLIKDKLLLFSGAFGGALFSMSADRLSKFFEFVFGIGAILAFIGVLINLTALAKIQKELKELEND